MIGIASDESVGADIPRTHRKDTATVMCSFASFDVFFKVILHTSSGASGEVSKSRTKPEANQGAEVWWYENWNM